MPRDSWPFEFPQGGQADRTVDVLCLGHALVDRLVHATPAHVEAANLTLGAMTLVEHARALEIGAAASGWSQVAGGSAANTSAGVASLGGRPAFAGAVGDDEFGHWYASDLEAAGVECFVAKVASGTPTGVCHVFVTEEGQRSMATSLGAACELPTQAVEAAGVARAQVLYVEGYLLDAAAAQAALEPALGYAEDSGTLVSLSLSDPYLVARHHDRISDLVFGGAVDVLLGNEEEALGLAGTSDLPTALERLRRSHLAVVVTRGARGAIVVLPDGEVAAGAAPVPRVADTTGAGDLFAAGFLFGLTHGFSPEESLRIGNFAAAEVISHVGARPEVRLAEVAPLGLLGAETG